VYWLNPTGLTIHPPATRDHRFGGFSRYRFCQYRGRAFLAGRRTRRIRPRNRAQRTQTGEDDHERSGLAIAGSTALQGDVITWVADHRRHHAFSDEEGDPKLDVAS
jgi:hypothetical protein